MVKNFHMPKTREMLHVATNIQKNNFLDYRLYSPGSDFNSYQFSSHSLIPHQSGFSLFKKYANLIPTIQAFVFVFLLS